MIPRRGILAAPLVLAAPALRAQELTLRQDLFTAPGLREGVLIRWGDRVAFDAPDWNPARPTAEAAASQFGWDARIVALLASPEASDGVPRAVLVVAHPTVDPAMAFPGGRDIPAVAGAMQGASLVNLARRGGAWVVVDGGFQNRRLTASTLCRLGSDGGPALGVLGVTGGCATPWGSVLLAEGDALAWSRRLGMAPPVGMLVEVDPSDPGTVPVKHAAPGRMAPVDAAAGLSADGRAVVWLVDGQRGGFLYRFVSDDAASSGALDAGRLAAARFDHDSLRWLPLSGNDPAAAARSVAATPLDEAAAVTFDAQRRLLCVATRGGAGQVIAIRAAAGDVASDTGIAELLLQGREAPPPPAPPRRDAAPPAAAAWPWAPASLAFDGAGGLLVGTDRGARPGILPEALYRVPADGSGRGQPSLLMALPVGAAAGGAAVTADGTLFGAVAHPGATPGATWANPATRWPAFRPDQPPRSTIMILSR